MARGTDVRERFDDRNERQRHKKFVRRDARLAAFDPRLAGNGTERWVVVTGGPGKGKGAI